MVVNFTNLKMKKLTLNEELTFLYLKSSIADSFISYNFLRDLFKNLILITN